MSLLRRGGFFRSLFDGSGAFGRSALDSSGAFGCGALDGSSRIARRLGDFSRRFGRSVGSFGRRLFLLGTAGAQHKGNRNGAQNLCIHRQIPQVRTVRRKGKVRGEDTEKPASMLLRVAEF